jgi:hypothetical protein
MFIESGKNICDNWNAGLNTQGKHIEVKLKNLKISPNLISHTITLSIYDFACHI